jgi:hypothetical protein
MEAEKKLLSWYTRNKTKKIDAIRTFSELLQSQRKFIGEEGQWVDWQVSMCESMNEQLVEICKPIMP